MASTSGPPKDEKSSVRLRGQRAAAAPPGDASTSAAAAGGAAVSPRGGGPPRPGLRVPRLGLGVVLDSAWGNPPPPLPPIRWDPDEALTQGGGHEQGGGGGGGGGRGADGSSSSSPPAPPDDRELQAQRSSNPSEGKLLGSSMRAHRAHAKKPYIIGQRAFRVREVDDAVMEIEMAEARNRIPRNKDEELPEIEEEEVVDEEKGLLNPVSERTNSPGSIILDYIISVFLGREGSLDKATKPLLLVHHQKFSLAYAPEHYCLPGLRGIISSNFLILLTKYSEFRVVRGDGECFYRSFIISYLEQVLDREGTDEEQRLLATVEVKIKPMAMQINYPELPTVFSWGYEFFKKLMQNIIGWKSGQNGDRCKKELLNFFSSERLSDDIFLFLRSVAVAWMCAHKDEYEPHVPVLGDGYPLELWCVTHVLPLRQYADHIPMRALAAALGVPLRVENLHGGPAHDIFTDDGMNTPRVTVLYTGIHYDILYPRLSSSSGGGSTQRAGCFWRFW
ncbi:uncharacterized protein LOC102702823 isoform X1 [Oryza brachyantha]|uniref:uncharacterized protein LOC102702823 isoform X1 n=1 Tax=Oryza brachyantha TaxID=4533 RepID=UPI001ADB2D57|nr:uncharacterized protein LOC102702823 isoform X1 [Oryza brachyantha]